MIQIRERSRTAHAQTFAMAVVVAALMALAAVGGYEIGSARAQSHSLVVQPLAAKPAPSAPQDAPPVTGFQP
jgi:hypothetical protein